MYVTYRYRRRGEEEACGREWNRSCNLLPMNIRVSLHTSYQENISLLAHNLHEIKRSMETSAQRHNKEKETIHGLNSKQRNTMKVNPHKRHLCWFQTLFKVTNTVQLCLPIY
jgi:hypothetical protein